MNLKITKDKPKIKINSKFFIEYENIKQIKKVNKICWVYQKEGYPKILKSDCNLNLFLLRIINSGVTDIEKFKKEKIK